MSETEAHTGRLVPMVLSGVTIEERCKDACKVLGYEFKEVYDSWEECFRTNCYKTAYIFDDVIYLIDDTKLDPDGFSVASQDSDGVINYTVMYYNGGASFDEVLDHAMERDIKGND